MPKIIIEFGKSKRLSPDVVENIERDIVNYLLHDYGELFESTYMFDLDGVEVELPGISIDTMSIP